MSRFLASVAGAAVFIGSASNAAAPASPPPDAAKLAEAHAIINVMFPPNSRESMLTQLQSQMVTQMMPDRVAWMQEPGIKKIIDDYIAEAEAEQRAVLLKHLPDQIDASRRLCAQVFAGRAQRHRRLRAFAVGAALSV